jgi:hypothetical protein
MAGTESLVLLILCALLLACVSSYIGGRVHQQRRAADQHQAAFRDGFHRASTALAGLTIGASDGDGAGRR